jgi:hypothetical protein
MRGLIGELRGTWAGVAIPFAKALRSEPGSAKSVLLAAVDELEGVGEDKPDAMAQRSGVVDKGVGKDMSAQRSGTADVAERRPNSSSAI